MKHIARGVERPHVKALLGARRVEEGTKVSDFLCLLLCVLTPLLGDRRRPCQYVRSTGWHPFWMFIGASGVLKDGEDALLRQQDSLCRR